MTISEGSARISTPVPAPLTKTCTGPSHEIPTELPLDHFYRRNSKGREGELLSRCKLCVNWAKLKNHHSNHGTVPVKEIRPFVREMVNRVGLQEAARLSGISRNGLAAIYHERSERVQKTTAAKILTTVEHQRKNGIFYHKTDIRAGIHTKEKLRTIDAPWEQYGPVYPNLEHEWRAELNEARRRAKKRQHEREDQLERLTGY